MTSKIRLAHLAALASLVGFSLLSAADRAAAQAVNLEGMGINADFEDPVLAHANLTEATSTNNIGPGWTREILAGAVSNYGVQDPIGEGANPFYCCFTPALPDGTGVLPAPFEGRQIGFFNLNDTDSMGQIVSIPVGSLLAGQTYSLTVAVGARSNTTAASLQAKILYAIGMRTAGGVDLGTLGTVTMTPGSNPLSANIQDLTYTLNVNSQAAAFVGQDVSIFIRGANGSGGPSPPDLAQANFDNVRLTGSFGVAANNAPALTINRATGAVTLSKTGLTNYTIAGYNLTSNTFGSFNQANWTRISTAYDQSGNDSVDPDDEWTVLSAANDSTDLSEAEISTGGNGGSLSTALPIQLGNAWRKTPYQDVTAKLLLTNGQELTVPVAYAGNAIAAGDLNGDGAINVTDWTTFKTSYSTNLTGMSIAQAYAFGDMDQSRTHTLADFAAFRSAYNAANPGATIESLGVPEPASALLLVVAAATCGRFCRRPRARRTAAGAMGLRSLGAALAALAAMAWALPSASAQTPIAHWSFDASDITVGANGITAAADETGAHNATSVYAGTGGTGAGPQINSVAGQFGAGAEFTNVNINGQGQVNRAWMSFPQLTEIAGAAGGSFSVGAWAKIPDSGATLWDPVTILADWGNAPANIPGPPQQGRFTYWFHLATAEANVNIRPRGQLRSANTAGGNGTDMAATTITEAQAGQASFDDGLWHHFVWAWDKPNYRMTYFVDGVQVAQAAGNAANPDHDLYVSASSVGAIGAKNDNNRYFTGTMDEVWVYNGLLDATQALNLKNFNDITGQVLTLVVDPVNGQAQIRNASPNTLTLDIASYEITSASGGLDKNGWQPIQVGGANGFPGGDGSGNGWEPDLTSTNNRLTEFFLESSSSMAPGRTVNLGAMYNEAMDATDLLFQYSTGSGGVINGLVVQGSVPIPADFEPDGDVDTTDFNNFKTNFGSQTATANSGDANGDGVSSGSDFLIWQRNRTNTGTVTPVPEPTGAVLALGACVALVAVARRRVQPALAVAPIRRGLPMLAAAACMGLAASAQATVHNDREYRMGDETGEGAADTAVVGSGNAFGTTFDSAGPGFVDLGTNGSDPSYANVGSSGLNRPGAAANSLGITFDGVNDHLFARRFGNPATSRSSTLNFPVISGESPGTNDYAGLSNRGFQLWVRPDLAGAGRTQNIVLDTNQHGLRTNAANQWVLRYNNADVASTEPVVRNAWTHAMVVRPYGSTGPNGGSILYINGKAVAARAGNYTVDSNQWLVVGADTGDGPEVTTPVDAIGNVPTEFYHGTLDQLTLFTMGVTVNGLDRGTWNFRTDNLFAAAGPAAGGLTAHIADVNQNGTFEQADVNDLIANWGFENLVSAVGGVGGVRAGDINTIKKGDLNFDGITDLKDVRILRSVVSASGAALDLSALPIPEPSGLMLAAAAGCAAIGVFRRRAQC